MAKGVHLAQPIDAFASLSDEQIVEHLHHHRDVAAFEVLMRRHNQRVFRAARSIVKSDAEAEDVTQEAHVRAFIHLGDFQGRASFATWLTKIAVHEAMARVRRGKRFDSWDPEDEEGAVMSDDLDPESNAASRQLAATVAEAIDLLPEGFRSVFVLRAIEELSVAETAACLDLTEETVKIRLHRARQKLQAHLATRSDADLRQTHRFDRERCDRIVVCVLGRMGLIG